MHIIKMRQNHKEEVQYRNKYNNDRLIWIILQQKMLKNKNELFI